MIELLSYIVEKLQQFVHNILGHKTDDVLQTLLRNALWAQDATIDIQDVVKWIDCKMESLLDNGCDEVCVVIGDELVKHLNDECNKEKYKAISSEFKDAIRSGIIIVAMTDIGIIDSQMIRSDEGLSQSTIHQFKGQPILKIKIK